MTALLPAAHELEVAGCSVLPVAADGTKRPGVAWAEFQHRRAEPHELEAWFAGTSYDGLGVVTGAISGNLELLEAEGRAVDAGLVKEFGQLLVDHGHEDLWNRLCGGWMETSPSGGIHWLYRVQAPIRGNTKLARRPNPDNPRLVDVLLETRGEGGYVVVAPSGGRTHPTGRGWTTIGAGPSACITLSVDERDVLHAVATLLDSMPTQPPPVPGTPSSSGTSSTATAGSELRPGDDYNARTSWDDILTPAGWTKVKPLAGGYAWTRPDKAARDGISATTGTSRDGEDRLYVFTTSTEFESERPYSKFAAHTLLAHHGDYAAAAGALRKAGYGSPTPDPVLSIVDIVPDAPGPAAATNTPQNESRHLHAVEGTSARQLDPAPVVTVGDSEDAHAHRLITTYGDLVRYCPQRKLWLVWNGSRWTWQPPGGGQVREYAKTVARALTDQQASLTQRRKALSATGITGCLKQAETDARVLVDQGQLDADPWILNTPAGAIDLRTGQLRAAEPSTLCTKTTRVAPTAEPDPLWARFLDDTFGHDAELRGYVQRLVGLTLIGQVRDQLLAFLHGVGANGKSTLAETLMHVLGTGETGYAMAAPAEMLMIRKHSEHPAELAQLAGARMVVCSELDDGQRFAEAKIKQLTGRDSINARFLYGQPFTFTPTHTLWLLGNHRPQARTGGEAFWRRVKLVEFAHVVPAEQRDPALGDKLNAIAATVLTWALEGVADYLQRGLAEPRTVAAAIEAYAADQDTVGRFVAEQCHRADSDLVSIQTGKLRADYEAWCRETGEEPVSAKRLTQELQDRFNVGEKRSNGKRFYTRICLVEADPEQATEPPENSAGSGTEDRDTGWFR